MLSYATYTQYSSSEVDWCEKNYERSEHIIEYYNSYSSLIIFLFGFIGYYYVKRSILFVMLGIIGLSSFYFHATLSFAGQILDELSISIILMLIIKKIYKDNINILHLTYAFFAIQFVIQFTYPFFNRFALFTYSVPILYKIKCEFTQHNKYAIFTICSLFFLSVVCWLFDFVCSDAMCIQFHAIWHCLIGVMAFLAIGRLETK